MRRHILAISLLTLAAATPAAADTIKEIAAHGMTLRFQGSSVDLTFTPDGKYTGMNGQINGTWRIDGDKICSSGGIRPGESCIAVPADKKSGDTFEVTLPAGLATVRIN
jgi:hypothetical protein